METGTKFVSTLTQILECRTLPRSEKSTVTQYEIERREAFPVFGSKAIILVVLLSSVDYCFESNPDSFTNPAELQKHKPSRLDLISY